MCPGGFDYLSVVYKAGSLGVDIYLTPYGAHMSYAFEEAHERRSPVRLSSISALYTAGNSGARLPGQL